MLAMNPCNIEEVETEQSTQFDALENIANDLDEMNRMLSSVTHLPSINQPRQESQLYNEPRQTYADPGAQDAIPPVNPPQKLPADVTPDMLFIDVDRVNAAKDERQKKRDQRRKAREERRKKREEEEAKNA